MKDVDDLHFPRSVDTMDVDHAPMHDEERLARITLAEEVFVFLQISYCGKRTDSLDIGGRKSRKNARAFQ